MLHLHQSNLLEHLAYSLIELGQNQVLHDPFAPETIIVQSRGMGRFLNRFLARHQGIAANLNLTLPASFTWKLMRSVLPEIPKDSPFDPEPLSWQIFSLLPALAEPEFAPIRHYIADSEESAFELACKLADIFDQYLVYRPDWIRAWETGKRIGLGENESWQAALWQKLSENPAPHRVRLLDDFLSQLPEADNLPERVSIFGIATLAPMYLHIIRHLAQYTEVHIFALNPCCEYWGDLIEPETILRQPEDYQDLSLSGHPLLASLGKQGRDFFDSLNELSVLEETEAFVENDAPTLLAVLQNDILNLQLPSAEAFRQQGNLALDDSIQIHNAHSPLRELQILKDQILYLLERYPHLRPDDFAILTPKIEAYAPFIEAVFGYNEQTPFIPYSITDTQIASSHPLLFAFSALLDLLESRFNVEEVLDLLDAEPLRRRFKITQENISVIAHYVKSMNIHWGLDEEMRAQYADKSADFTWSQGLDRLVLGFMLPQSLTEGHAIPVWQGIVPSQNSYAQIEPLSRFILLVRTLQTIYQRWQQPATIQEWVARLHQTLEELFEPSVSDQGALSQLEDAITQLNEHTRTADYQQSVSGSIIRAYIRQYLGYSQEYSLLRGGLTFCNMVPMRSLPFKVLCLIGLNDGDYPRDERAASFDLIAQHPKKGDRSRRNDDRYLFLEAILSAREKLYLSFVGRSIKTDEKLPPSPLLSELMDTLAKMTDLQPSEIEKELVIQHPLQPFSRRYFNQSNPQLFSYDQEIAAALNRPLQAKRAFAQTPLNPELPTETTWELFCRFWRHPVRYWLTHVLAVTPLYLDNMPQTSEPFSLDSRQTEYINQMFLNARMEAQPTQIVQEILHAQGLLPAGKLGLLYERQQRQKIEALTLPPLIEEPVITGLHFQLQLNRLELNGTLNTLRPGGQLFLKGAKLNAPDKVAYMLHHLLLCALAPKEVTDLSTYVLTPEEQTVYMPMPQAEAIRQLSVWSDAFLKGQTLPLPFFPRTSLAAAEAFHKTYRPEKETPNPHQAAESAIKAARNQFTGYGPYIGQGSEQEIMLVFGQTDPLDDPLFLQLVTELLLPVYPYQKEGDA